MIYIDVHIYLKISYCLNFIRICSLGDCLQIVKNIFFLNIDTFPIPAQKTLI